MGHGVEVNIPLTTRAPIPSLGSTDNEFRAIVPLSERIELGKDAGCFNIWPKPMVPDRRRSMRNLVVTMVAAVAVVTGPSVAFACKAGDKTTKHGKTYTCNCMILNNGA